jgi:hypothetical protein
MSSYNKKPTSSYYQNKKKRPMAEKARDASSSYFGKAKSPEPKPKPKLKKDVKKKERKKPVLGSNKNVNAGTGRGTSTMEGKDIAYKSRGKSKTPPSPGALGNPFGLRTAVRKLKEMGPSGVIKVLGGVKKHGGKIPKYKTGKLVKVPSHRGCGKANTSKIRRTRMV